MRTIICGSRGIDNYPYLKRAVDTCLWTPTVILSGGARGVDALGERYAKENNIPLELYPADWDKHRRSAGYIRNKIMAENAEAVIALWDRKSKGTQHMINIAREHGLRVCVYEMA